MPIVLARSHSLAGPSDPRATFARTATRISSGRRVERAADDAAGLAVSVNLSIQASGERVHQRNIQDGITMVAIGDGAAAELGSTLKRMRELAVQAAAETLSDEGRQDVDEEFQALKEEVNRVASSTTAKGRLMVNGTSAPIAVGLGGSTIGISTVDLGTAGLGLTSASVATSASASQAIDDLDLALDRVNLARAGFGALQSRLVHALTASELGAEALQSATARVSDADLAAEAATLIRARVLQDAALAMTSQQRGVEQSLLAGLL